MCVSLFVCLFFKGDCSGFTYGQAKVLRGDKSQLQSCQVAEGEAAKEQAEQAEQGSPEAVEPTKEACTVSCRKQD